MLPGYLFLSLCVLGVDADPIVTSSAGTFHGSYLSSRRGRQISSFRGVRYAEAPTGEKRFRPPVLVTNYAQQLGSELVNATTDGPACPQPGTWLGQPDEDCLRLNVYSLNTSRSKQYPVMVYYHAGGYYSVSGQSFIEGPQYLLDHDVILVTVNYRLGSLGFISTGDRHAPGNLGLKDQVASLRWIQKNIANFGGGPDRVTIAGYSAGAISVTMHMLSPMSAGLFHGVIAMSGAGTAQWEVPKHQYSLAEKQASLVGCPHNSSQEIIQCLKTVGADKLGNSLQGFYEFANQDPILIWLPVIEPNCGQERFLTDHPVKLIQEGKFHDVPLIIGMTELEFTGSAFNVLKNSTNSRLLDQHWNDIAPIPFIYERNTSRSVTASKKFREFYLGDRKLVYTNNTAFALGKLYGDGVIAFGVHRFANLMSNYSKNPVYYYLFNYTGTQSHFTYPDTKTPIGAVHHDDLIYLFNISAIFTPIELGTQDSAMVDKMTTLYTNFVANGDPNPKGSHTVLEDLNWPTMTPENRQYLQINRQFSVGTKLFENRFDVWEELFPIAL